MEVFRLIHTVKPGETLTQISRDYRTPLSEIIAANPTINPNVIYPGQPIMIPGFPPPDTIPFQIDVSVNNRKLRLLKKWSIAKAIPDRRWKNAVRYTGRKIHHH